MEPAKDLVSLLHAFAEIRTAEPRSRLRIVGRPSGPEGAAYLGHCTALAAQLFPDEADGPHAVGQNPVSFEELGGPGAETAAAVRAGGAVTVLSSVVEGFPVGLIESMFCGRATVSTDVGAVVEVIGGTGLVVPPRNPRALAEACVSLLRDPERRARLGAAARARALELFTVEQNVTAFHGLYLEIVARTPVRRPVLDGTGDPSPSPPPPRPMSPATGPNPPPRRPHLGRGDAGARHGDRQMTDLSALDRGTPPGAADPVKVLLHRHRELCERAVDPLEIAAGLEAHGITDRTAARFRHRDVFSLAEELYARVPRDSETGTPGPDGASGTDARSREGSARGQSRSSSCPCFPASCARRR